MYKDSSNNSIFQEKMLFSLPETVSDKKICVDFNAPDMSSNGGLMLLGNMHGSLAWKIGQLIPDFRRQEFVHHSYMEMVSRRIGQILCGYEDANDCNQLRGDSHFASHEFMDWAYNKRYVRYLTGLSGNQVLLGLVDKQRKRAENDYIRAQKAENYRCNTLRQGYDVKRERIVIRRYFKFEYKAGIWGHSQRVIAKIEVSAEGSNIRFVVTSNRNNSAETIHKHYCRRGEMELWIKNLKYFKADRMSCNNYRANCFRLFLYAAAFVMAHKMKHTIFRNTQVERFTMDSLIKRIMLIAVYITEKKTFIRISFSPHHRHLEEMMTALGRIAA